MRNLHHKYLVILFTLQLGFRSLMKMKIYLHTKTNEFVHLDLPIHKFCSHLLPRYIVSISAISPFIALLFYQNTTKELLLKCNLSVYFIVNRNCHITTNYSLVITGNHNPFCFIIIIPVINSNDLSCELLNC